MRPPVRSSPRIRHVHSGRAGRGSTSQWARPAALGGVFHRGGQGWRFLRALSSGWRRAGVWTGPPLVSVRPRRSLRSGAFVVGSAPLRFARSCSGSSASSSVIASSRVARRVAPAFPRAARGFAWANLHGSFFLGVAAAGAGVLADLRGPVEREAARRRESSPGRLRERRHAFSGPARGRTRSGFDQRRRRAGWSPSAARTSRSHLLVLFYLTVLVVAICSSVGPPSKRAMAALPRCSGSGGLARGRGMAERGWSGGPSACRLGWHRRLLGSAELSAGRRDPGSPGLNRDIPASQPRGFVLVLVALIVGLQPVCGRSRRSAARTDASRTRPRLALHARHGISRRRAVVPQRWASWLNWAAPASRDGDSRIEVHACFCVADYLPSRRWVRAIGTLARIRATLVVVDRRSRARCFARSRRRFQAGMWVTKTGRPPSCDDLDGRHRNTRGTMGNNL